MNAVQLLAAFLPHLLSAPLLPLAILAIAVLTLSTLAAADTTVQERQQQRQKEESGEAVALTKTHAIGFGFMASVGLLAMWMWSNVIAFVYDVFFVFVTPYLTTSGESIMEAAATGAAMTVNEHVPMLFRVPSFSSDGGEAILGFGDVVLPGILVTFLKECDARLEEDHSLPGLASLIGTHHPSMLPVPCLTKKGWWGKRWSYHLTAVLGFAVGLELTFVAMMWSNKGQPALLYLVPCTVLPVIILASRRHELSLLWNGWSELEEEKLLENEDKNEQGIESETCLETVEKDRMPAFSDEITL
ncbi:Signal peptide peptidase-like 2A [Mortierella sp. GBA43]|nr:Signal peptide peptidase-like 2A [Mortierella sp. GBA43]